MNAHVLNSSSLRLKRPESSGLAVLFFLLGAPHIYTVLRTPRLRNQAIARIAHVCLGRLLAVSVMTALLVSVIEVCLP
jgi:hypothetical protein